MAVSVDDNMDQLSGPRKRTRKVRPYPAYTLEETLAIATRIQEANAGLAFDRSLLARELGTTPASSGYTMRLNASSKYGLTQGGYNDARISLTAQGQTIVAPENDDELRGALAASAMRPEIFGRFYRMLDGKRLQEDEYAENILQRELGIHPELSHECFAIIKANGRYVGILKEVGDALYVDLEAARASAAESARPLTADSAPHKAEDTGRLSAPDTSRTKIFLGGSGATEALRLVRDLLDDFGIAYATAEDGADAEEVEPLGSHVSEEMKRCAAAVLTLGVSDGDGHDGLASLLLLAGAARALYADAVVLLTQAGLELPDALATFRRVPFDPDRSDSASLALLRELSRARVLKVTA